MTGSKLAQANHGIHVACAIFDDREVLLEEAEEERLMGRTPYCKKYQDCQLCERDRVLSHVSANLDESVKTADD